MILLLLALPAVLLAAMDGCFERVRNHTLIGALVVTLDDVTLTQCQHACLEARKQSCRSFMYHPAEQRCFMNSEDRKTRESAFFHVLDAIDYYHRTCYHKPSMLMKTFKSTSDVQHDSVFDDKCYETIKGKVLIGIVDQLIQGVTSIEQCRKRCQKSKEVSDIVCKSAIYYEKEKECIIASQSRIDIPDLFIEDDQAVYMENTCLNDSAANMKKLQAISEINTEKSTKAPEPIVKSRHVTGGSIQPPTPDFSTSTNASHETSAHNFSTLARAAQEIKKKAPSNVELSGYDAPSDTVSEHTGTMDVMTEGTTMPTSTSTTTEKPPTTISAKVIDSYNVDAAVKTPVEVGYGRRLRDSKIKECFSEVRPLRPMEQTRITKAYSLEQCTDICRLCWRCLQGKKCLGVAFDQSLELCALSTRHIVDGGDMQDIDAIVYHNRNDC